MWAYTPLLVVLALAGLLRLGYAGVNSFAFDEARLSLIALRMARGGEFASVGMPSSAGVPNMPAAAWVFALPYALSANPQVATTFVSLLSLLTVVGVWALARQWGARAAWVAALYIALNPFAVLYGRSIWAQNLLIPLAVAWVWAVYVAVRPNQARRGVWVGLAVFLTGFTVQVHFAGAALVVGGAYVFLRWRWWRHPAAVSVGAALALACAMPFVLTPGAVRGVLDAAGGGAQVDLTAWRATLLPIAGVNWSYLLHGEADLPLVRATPAVIAGGIGALFAVLVAMMGVFGAAAVLNIDGAPQDEVEHKSTAKSEADAPTTAPPLTELALVLLVVFPLFFTRHSTPVFVHYLLPTVPAAALLLGWAARDGHPKLLRNAVTVGVLVMGVAWFGQLVRAFPFAAGQHTPNGIATPLGVLQAAAQAPPPDTPLLYFTHGDDPSTQGEPAIFTALWWNRAAGTRILDGRNVLVLPPYPATMLFTERPFQAWEEMRASDLLVDTHELPRRDGVEPWQLMTYDGETAPVGFTLLAEPITFEHGATLLGWRTYTIGPRTRVSTLWQAPGALPADVQQFHHLRTPTTLEGEPFAVSDVSVRGHTWQADDSVIIMADFFQLEPELAYTVDVGHYTLPDVTRIPHADSDVVRLGTFTVQASE